MAGCPESRSGPARACDLQGSQPLSGPHFSPCQGCTHRRRLFPGISEAASWTKCGPVLPQPGIPPKDGSLYHTRPPLARAAGGKVSRSDPSPDPAAPTRSPASAAILASAFRQPLRSVLCSAPDAPGRRPKRLGWCGKTGTRVGTFHLCGRPTAARLRTPHAEIEHRGTRGESWQKEEGSPFSSYPGKQKA